MSERRRDFTNGDVFALVAASESVLRCMREGKPFFPDGAYADHLERVLEPFRQGDRSEASQSGERSVDDDDKWPRSTIVFGIVLFSSIFVFFVFYAWAVAQ